MREDAYEPSVRKQLARLRATPQYDVVVSFVLYDQPEAEWRNAVEQALGSSLAIHVVLVSNRREPSPSYDDPRVTTVHSSSNVGYGRAHNLAIDLMRGRARFHVLANTDIAFDGDPLTVLATIMNSDPSVGMAAPRLRYDDGRIQANARLLPAPGDLLAKRIPLRSARGRARRDAFLLRGLTAGRPVDVPFLTGPFLFCRAELLEALGGFDPRFFMFGEDVDLSRRAHRLMRTVLVPEVEIVHLSRSETRPSFWRLLLLIDGYRRYFRKWGWFHDREREEVNRSALRHIAAHHSPHGTV